MNILANNNQIYKNQCVDAADVVNTQKRTAHDAYFIQI